ncbi:LysR family transcriptional regulator [Ramlibacter sp.]|uniref:LysR family transcriptional regulator n=1 Tax=Ramlibacter sp. TaxID=1917967 RepID=UPI003D0DB711
MQDERSALQAAPPHFKNATPGVTLELLSLFVAVADAGAIAQAARGLQMAPSVATRKIAALEAALQARLFDRTTRRIHLTAAGAVALAWARDVVAGHTRLADELTAMQGRPSGVLRLVMNEYVCTVLLPPFLAAFSRKFPEIRYIVTMSDTLVTADDRDYDVAVHSGQVPDSSLMGVRIRPVQRVLCASPDYLARRGEPRSLQDLAEHDCLVHRQSAGGAWFFKQGDTILRQEIRETVLANSYLPLIQFARQGMGLIRVSRTAVRDDLAAGRFVQVLPEYANVYPDGQSPEIWILYPGKRLLQRTRMFVSELTDYLKHLE